MKKILLSFLLIGGLGVSADAQLYDHTGSLSSSGVVSNYFLGLDTLVQCADDFVIPTGGTWDVNSVTVHGFRNASGGPGNPMDSVRIQIYNNNSGVPGTTIYDATHTCNVPVPQGDTALVFTIPTQTLTEGTYWLSVYGYAAQGERWNWTQSTAVDGSNGMLIDVDDMFGAGATTWTDVSGLVADPDFAFIIDGTGYMASIEEDQKVEVSVYPNPTVDFVTINAGQDYVQQVSVFNASGERITTAVNPLESKIDVSELPAGLYILEVTTTSGMAHVEIIKE